MSKGILSYSLFRAPHPIYWRTDATEDRVSAYARYLPVLVRAHQAIWPGYELRIHHDEAVQSHPYFEALVRLQERGLLRLVPCGQATALTLAMLWRMKPIFEEGADLVLTCDLDALPILRLRRVVESFAASGRSAMIVHGCESHNGVMGGGFGVRAGRFRDLTGCGSFAGFVGRGGPWDAYAADEEFLRCTIWPMVEREGVIFRQGGAPLNLRCGDVRPHPNPVPVEGLLPEVEERGDWYAPYIGSAGYEIGRAFEFYQGLPLPVMQEIRQCEGESLDLRAVMRL